MFHNYNIIDPRFKTEEFKLWIILELTTLKDRERSPKVIDTIEKIKLRETLIKASDLKKLYFNCIRRNMKISHQNEFNLTAQRTNITEKEMKIHLKKQVLKVRKQQKVNQHQVPQKFRPFGIVVIKWKLNNFQNSDT